MEKRFSALVINPGSTSTKIAVFTGEKKRIEKNIPHSQKKLARFKRIADQKSFRKKIILSLLKKNNTPLNGIDIVVGRGGLTRPVSGGVYWINEKMLRDVANPAIHGREHASSLGLLMAYTIAKKIGVKAVTMDPVATDELAPVARVSGFPEIERKSLFHALNVKAVSRKAARRLGKKRARLVVAHMGGGISIAAYENARVIDVNNAVLGMGPFSPQRAGSLPIADLVRLCFSGKYTESALLKKLAKKSGLTGYLGTDDMLEIQKKIRSGNKKAALVFQAMVYQIAKEIGAYATVFGGRHDAIVFTGGLARSGMLMKALRKRVGFLGKILIFPGEEELKALAHAGLMVLKGRIKPMEYR